MKKWKLWTICWKKFLIAVIEELPTFPGCEKLAKSERRQCFQDRMDWHVRRTFRYPEIAREMGIQGRVYVSFVIDENITKYKSTDRTRT